MASAVLRRCVCEAAVNAGFSSQPTTTSFQPQRTFASTSYSLISQAKIRDRQRRKAHRLRREAQTKERERTEPDPVLGYPTQIRGANSQWENCELKKLLVSREEVWSGKFRDVPAGNQTEVGEVLNFGLGQEEATFLFQALPAVSSQRAALGDAGAFKASAEAKHEESAALEERKAAALAKALDLRNADSKEIEKFNIGRIIGRFSNRPDTAVHNDSGCPEVQAAILTYRIHYLMYFLWNNVTDLHNRRVLTRHVMQRKKILNYLKRRDEDRYDTLLPRLGLTPRAVEGEIIVRKGLPPQPGVSRL